MTDDDPATNCPDKTVYSEKESFYLAGKQFCERWADVEGWPGSMYCNEILSSHKCPRGYLP